jgi:MoaA/NifB/PqqE/SkfB family radical SAM enzyme
MRQADLEWDTFECFLSSHPSLEYVELQGEGEPLLHPKFFDMVAACRARGIRVSLITNGSLLGEQAVERLVWQQVNSVHVSLESADPDEFQGIRGGKFAKVVDGLCLLVKRRRDLGAVWPKVGLCVTVLRRTLTAIAPIIALYKDLQLDGGISVQRLQTMLCYTEKYDQEMLAQIVPTELWRSYMQRFREILQETGVRVGEPSGYQALFADFDPHAGRCPWLERGAYLGSDGTVTGCCLMKNPSHALGRIGQDSPDSIAVRRQMLARTLHRGEVPSPCIGCGIANMIVRSRVEPAQQ